MLVGHVRLRPAMERRPDLAPPIIPVGLAAAGTARPALPVAVFGEDFSLVIRTPRRLRLVRGKIRVLS